MSRAGKQSGGLFSRRTPVASAEVVEFRAALAVCGWVAIEV